MRIDNWSSRFFTLLLISGSFASAQLKSGLEESDPPSTHNMLVVGGKTVFLSHLPMFDDLSEDKSWRRDLFGIEKMSRIFTQKIGRPTPA